MVETATYAPAPKAMPRINRDRAAVILAVVGAGPNILLMLLGTWIEGRLNSAAALDPLGCVSMLAYPVIALVLLGRVTFRFHRGTATQRIRWLLLLTLAASPVLVWRMPRSSTILFGGYLGGFSAWTRANVDAKVVREWGATVPFDAGKGSEHVDYWMDRPLPGITFVPMPKEAWPECVAGTEPDEVYMLSDRSAVILYWPSGHGWLRAIVVAASTTGPPPQDWRELTDFGQGVWVYIRGPV